jgi:NADPH-dependent curcumin reductase CurA
MPDIVSRQIRLAARPEGRPGQEHFRMDEEKLTSPGEGQVLLQTLYMSLDPYMRGRMNAGKSYAKPVEIGAVMEGGTVSRVLESRYPDFVAGDVVLSHSGWQTHALAEGKGLRKLDPAVAPVSTALGVLGMPGFTAYAGLLTIGQPKPGQTVVVAAATGPVGSAVGQIARLKGARAVGIAGGAEKCAYLTREFGFDAAIDHRAADFAEKLQAACPDGIDVYFENVGGAVWDAVFPLLNDFARIPVCGLVAHYNGETTASGPDRLPGLMRQVLSRSLNIRGFIQHEFVAQQPAFLTEMSAWIAEGKVRYREDVVDGLDNVPAAFAGMLEGKNFGKLLVKLAD